MQKMAISETIVKYYVNLQDFFLFVRESMYKESLALFTSHVNPDRHSWIGELQQVLGGVYIDMMSTGS